MSKEGIPYFTPGEYQRRYEAVRALMDQEGADALLVFGHSGNRQHYQAHVHYLAHAAPRHECYLIFPKRGEPVLFTTHYNHLASAKEVSVIPDVRRSGRDAAGAVAAELKKRGFAAIGVVGDVFYQAMDALRRDLPAVKWKDLTAPCRLLRSRKSDEEIAFQRKAALGVDAAMDALIRELRPGASERDLLVATEKAAWDAGCEPVFLYLNSTPMAASESCVPNQNVSRRKIRMGDVLNTELTVGYGMYTAQILRPFFLGEPTPAYARLYEVAKAVHDRVAGVLKAGATAQEVHDATGLIAESGFTIVDGLIHGFGVDILPPSIRCTLFTPPAPFTFEKNMTVVVQPNPTTKDEKMGVQLGELGLITEGGFEPMHRLPAEVVRVG